MYPGKYGPDFGLLRLLLRVADFCLAVRELFPSVAFPDVEDFLSGDNDLGFWDSSSLVDVFFDFLGDLKKRFI